MAAPVIAIDFGTYESSARVVTGRDIKQDYVPDPGSGNEQSDWRSAVYWDGARLLVGRAAQEQWTTEPDRYRMEFKPLLRDRLPVALGDSDGRKRNFLPEELVVRFLAAMREAAESKYALKNTLKQAVITVPPAYFELDDERAKLMLAAAHEAGFTERVELISEPVAAALAEPAGGRFAAGTRVLVYDFGGGTFDAAVVLVGVDGTNVPALSIDSCGGMQVDAAIKAWLGEHYSSIGALISRGVADDEGLSTARRLMHLGELCETLKRRLSAPGADVVGMRSDHLDVHVTMKAEDLDECAADIIGKTLSCCEDLLREAGKTPADLDAILLVGGSSRLRGVRERLARQLGVRQDIIRHAVRPTLAVVDGAALFAAQADERVSGRTPDDPRVRAVRWDIPGELATVVRWQVRPRDSYVRGQELAELRLRSGEIYRLADDQDGTVATAHAGADQWVRGGDWLLTSWRPFNGGWEQPLGFGDVAPVVSDRAVFTGTKAGTVYALAAATGDVWWRQYLGSAITAPLTVQRGRVYAGCLDGRLHVLDQRTGEEVSDPAPPVGGAITSAPLSAGGRIWLAADNGVLYGLAPDGDRAEFECDPGTYPVLSGAVLCVRGTAGSLYGVDPYSAARVPDWNRGLADGRGQHSAVGGTVYEYYRDSGIRKLSGLTGRVEAKHELEPKDPQEAPARGTRGFPALRRHGQATPAAEPEPLLLGRPVCGYDTGGGATVYAGTADGRLFALDADTLRPREPAQRLTGSPVSFLSFADGTLYAAAADKKVYVVDARPGLAVMNTYAVVGTRSGLPLLKEHQVDVQVTAEPAVGYGAVYVTAADGILRAFPGQAEGTV